MLRKVNEKLPEASFLYFGMLLLYLVFPGHVHAAKETGGNFLVTVETASFEPKEKEKYHLDVVHPYAFELATIKKCMAGIAYQERDISWTRKKRIFSDAAIARLSPLIVEQFTRADTDHRVLFKVTKPSGKIFLQGDAFVTKKGLHWRLTVVNYSQRKLEDFSIMGDSWRLVSLKGQAYKTRKPHKNLVQDITNWIVFTKFHPVASRILEAPVKETADGKSGVSSSAETIGHRLKILETLKRDGLVSEEEYRVKRLEILKSF
jgi:hypothetical protein